MSKTVTFRLELSLFFQKTSEIKLEMPLIQNFEVRKSVTEYLIQSLVSI